MNTLMFFYTLAILVICIVTAVLSLAAYASSRRRLFIYGSGVFICYAIEMTEIFFFEYTLQNQSFRLATITQSLCLCCGPLWRPPHRLLFG